MKKALKMTFAITAAVVLLISVFLIVLKISWQPTIKEKSDLTPSEVSVIASELSIPEEDLSISKMRFTHAKDTVIRVYASTVSLSVLDNSYKLSNGSETEYTSTINDTTSCIAEKNGDKYELEFIIRGHDQKLIGIMG